MVDEYQHLIQSHIKVNTTYESPKFEIGMPNEEKMNYIENFWFLETEHQSLIERNNALTQEIEYWRKYISSKNKVFHPKAKILNDIINKVRFHGDKRGLGYINKIETPTSRETIFVKSKEETLSLVVSSSIISQCTYCKKSIHSHGRCFSRLFERYELHLNRIVSKSKFLKN